MISALYTSTESAIKSKGDVSCFFPVNSRMRQGCALVPNTCIINVMGDTVGKTDCGISLGEDRMGNFVGGRHVSSIDSYVYLGNAIDS